MLYSACKDTEKKLKLQATTNKIGVVAGLIFQPDALCLRCGMAGKRKPYKGRHTVTGGCPRCKRACFAAQNRLFCSVKQWVLQLQDVRFVSFWQWDGCTIWKFTEYVYGFFMSQPSVRLPVTLHSLHCFLQSFICVLPSWLPFILGVVRYVFEWMTVQSG